VISVDLAGMAVSNFSELMSKDCAKPLTDLSPEIIPGGRSIAFFQKTPLPCKPDHKSGPYL
jgi:hypothetical protein